MRFAPVVLFVITLVFFAVNSNAVYAHDKGAFGAGVVLGDPVGPTLKYWIDSNAAIDVGLGFDNDMIFYSDFLWHEWKLFPQPQKGKLAGYFGAGVRFQDKDEDDEFGFRAVAGASYWIASTPIELYLEIAPVFQVSPDTDVDLNAGIGLRYYFTGS
ncbi:MAG: hypothetical protein AB1499_15790 [Nitrospirota bacterium]